MVKRKASKSPRTAAPHRLESTDHAARGSYWIYGRHAVLAALGNPRRRGERLLLTSEALRLNEAPLRPLLREVRSDLVQAPAERETLDACLPEGAVHQGMAYRVRPLAQPDWRELGAERGKMSGEEPGTGRRLVVALDHVTDPQNVGAVLRSAAAFGALAVLTTARYAPPESGTLAKAASGALERVPYLAVGNLAQALDRFKSEGFWALGLADEAATLLAACDPGPRVVLVLGAEGSGLRRLTRERCDLLARLPTRPPIDHLNVSSAAAIALYELLGRSGP